MNPHHAQTRTLPAGCLGEYVTGTRKRYDYIFKCLACGGLGVSQRSDAVTCSPRCRVWLHRHPDALRAVEALATAQDTSVPEIQRAHAARLLCPELIPRVMAGEVTFSDIRGNIAETCWRNALAYAKELRNPDSTCSETEQGHQNT